MSNLDPTSDFVDEWGKWHHEHELRRARPGGFLSITGLHWLDDEPRRFDDVPGAWSTGDDGVLVTLKEDEELTHDGARVTGAHRFERIDEVGAWASFGENLVEIARRDGSFMIRPRHRDHLIRTQYRGTPTYPPSVEWVLGGRFVAYDAPRSVTVGATVEGLEHVYESPGEVEFRHSGKVLRLVTFNGDESDEFEIVFTDETAGSTTYAACRFLSVRGLGPNGEVALDFNRATNPPCAYTDFATCPLPPSENHLPIRVEAGERLPLRPTHVTV